MDDYTRFWIAQQVADTKNIADVQPLFVHDKEITCKRPNTLISDGALNFHDAFNKEFAPHRLSTSAYSSYSDSRLLQHFQNGAHEWGGAET